MEKDSRKLDRALALEVTKASLPGEQRYSSPSTRLILHKGEDGEWKDLDITLRDLNNN